MTAYATTYTRNEIRRTLVNKQFLVFTIGLPLALFLLVSSNDDGTSVGGLTIAPYYMVSMATFGVLGSVFSTSGRIAAERATGWTRQLRLTALSGTQYVLGKAATGYVIALPAMTLVLVLGAAVRDVRLGAGTWLAIAVSLLLTSLPIAALGVWLGYVVKSDNAQAISGGVYSLLGFAGGLWIPIETFPGWIQGIAEAFPMVWVAKAGRSALAGDWLGWHGTGVLLAWTVVLVALASRAYGKDAERA